MVEELSEEQNALQLPGTVEITLIVQKLYLCY